MNNFKTLAEARAAYDLLVAQLAEMEQKTAKMAELEAQLAEAKAFGSVAATENENFRLLIVQKDGEIGTKTDQLEHVKTEIAGLRTQLSELEKEQKTAKTHARELVAASGGLPISVDAGEISRMQAGDEKDFVRRMAQEQDPVRLGQLYSEYNRLFRPNGKQKKK